MKIINPLYDQAFKYMMDNEEIAKKILTIILEEEVVSLQSKPQEVKVFNKLPVHIPLSRFDFKAIIKTADNEFRNVLIEIQKSKTPDPIIRFRRYLGKNYIRKESFVDTMGNEKEDVLPIITIYFLGYSLPEYDSPAIVVNNRVIDAVTKKPIEHKNRFVQLLTHPSYILQIGKVREERRTKIEKFLSIFDQEKQSDEKFILDFDEKAEPIVTDPDFADIFTHLHHATLNEAMLDSLFYEEDYEEGIEKLEKELEEAQQREKNMLDKLRSTALMLKNAGVPIDEIAKTTGLKPDDIESL